MAVPNSCVELVPIQCSLTIDHCKLEKTTLKQHCEDKPGRNRVTQCYSSTENIGIVLVHSPWENDLHNILTQGCFKPLLKKSSSSCSFSPSLSYPEALLSFCLSRAVSFFHIATLICYLTFWFFFHQEMGVQKDLKIGYCINSSGLNRIRKW